MRWTCYDCIDIINVTKGHYTNERSIYDDVINTPMFPYYKNAKYFWREFLYCSSVQKGRKPRGPCFQTFLSVTNSLEIELETFSLSENQGNK